MCQMRKTYPRGSVKENFVCRDNNKQEVDMKRSLFGRPLLSMSAAFVALAIAWPAGAQSQQPIYGSQLMTQQERLEYQQRIRSAKSQAERQRIRSEHHAQMQERARQEGVTLPGMGPGQGQGMGPGQGHSQQEWVPAKAKEWVPAKAKEWVPAKAKEWVPVRAAAENSKPPYIACSRRWHCWIADRGRSEAGLVCFNRPKNESWSMI